MVPGEVLGDGRYELRGVLGRSATSEVRDGWDSRLSRPVAIKLVYPAADARRPGNPQPDTKERAVLQPTGRHVVEIYDVGEHNGVSFIVMERLPGVSLADSLARGPLAPAFVEVVLDGVLDALAEAHSVGILHRDVRPANILFTPRGEAKLTDFDIPTMSVAVDIDARNDVGRMAYLSPELLNCQAATVSDDLYAVGVVGYEALTGRRPFLQEDPETLADAILHESPPPLTRLRPHVPAGLATAIERAMARDLAERFEKADEMRTAVIDT